LGENEPQFKSLQLAESAGTPKKKQQKSRNTKKEEGPTDITPHIERVGGQASKNGEKSENLGQVWFFF